MSMDAWTMRATEWVGMHAPPRLGRALADLVLRYRYERMPRERATVAGNLSRVLGLPVDAELVRTATREAFALYGRYWYETFALRTMPWNEVDRRFRATGVEHIDRGYDDIVGKLRSLGATIRRNGETAATGAAA